MKEACGQLDDEVHTEGCHDLCLRDKGLRPDTTVQQKKLCVSIISTFFGLAVSSLLKNVDKH